MSEQDLEKLSELMRSSIEVKTRTYHLSSYPKSFLGKDAVSWLITNGHAESVEEALVVGNSMMGMGLIKHVLNSEDFANKEFFYQFLADGDHGEQTKKEDGTRFSWADKIRAQLWGEGTRNDEDLLPEVGAGGSNDDVKVPDPTGLGVSPLDKHNLELLDHVHPSKWINPAGDGMYNLVAIGGGAGGLVATSVGANIGARVALIERHLLGGDCLNVGCVPSKALLKAARVAHFARNGAKYGIKVDKVEVDFPEVMRRMRRLRTRIAPIDGAETKTKRGIDVFIGAGRFLDANHIEVTGDDGSKRVLAFKKAVIATGASPSLPPIPGLQNVPYTTNHTLYNLEVLPPRMIVIGAGPVGLEMAQAFQRFGSHVTVLMRGPTVLPREDPDAAAIVKKQLAEDGVQFHHNLKFRSVSHKDGSPFPEITVTVELEDGSVVNHVCEVLLIATGRRPNVEGVGLEAAGVKYSVTDGVEINDKMQTSQSHIYAVGDCCMKYKFTHVSGTQGAMAMRNALFHGNERVSKMLIPWVTYTEPEVAHVGLYEADMKAKGIEYQTFVKPLDDVDRAILEDETEGFVKLHVRAGTDQILGATIVASAAGEMISEISVAMQNKLGVSGIFSVIHPYPTQAEAIRGAAALYMFTRLTPRIKATLRNLMRFSRS